MAVGKAFLQAQLPSGNVGTMSPRSHEFHQEQTSHRSSGKSQLQPLACSRYSAKREEGEIDWQLDPEARTMAEAQSQSPRRVQEQHQVSQEVQEQLGWQELHRQA